MAVTNPSLKGQDLLFGAIPKTVGTLTSYDKKRNIVERVLYAFDTLETTKISHVTDLILCRNLILDYL